MTHEKCTPARSRKRTQRRIRGMAVRGALAMIAFWLVVMTVLYFAMDRFQQPRAARVTANGQLEIPRHRDGHFRVAGAVNGEPVMFLVDTGASIVSVSDALAGRAALADRESASFRTAGGERTGQIGRADVVSLQGGFRVTQLRVGIGLAMGSDTEALLGQNFLQHFDVQMDRDRMVLRPRAR